MTDFTLPATSRNRTTVQRLGYSLLCLLTLFYSYPLHANGQKNLLENASFEVQMESDSSLPEVWRVEKGGTLEDTHMSNRELALRGQYSARLVHLNQDLPNARVIWIQHGIGPRLKEIANGTEMELSVYARAEGADATVHVYLESPTARKTWGKQEKLAAGQWQKIPIRFTKEDLNFSTTYVCLRLAGPGDVSFDEAYLGVAPPQQEEEHGREGQNIIRNGSLAEVDDVSGEPKDWKLVIKDGVSKGSVDRTVADHGANSLYMESNQPKAGIYWMQSDLAKRLGDCPPGMEMRLQLRANTGGEPGTRFRFYFEMRKQGRFIGLFRSGPESSYFGWDTFGINFTMPDEIPDEAYLVIALENEGRVWVDQIVLSPAQQVQLPQTALERQANDFCHVRNFPRRQTYTVPEQPGELTLEYHLPASELTVTLSEIDGKEIRKYPFRDLPVRKTATVRLPIPPLPEGAYELRYESGEGEEQLRENDLFRIRQPQTRGVAFGAGRRMLLDGEPFFPIGVLTPLLSRDAFRVYAQSGINTVNVAGYGNDPLLTEYMDAETSRHKLAVFNWNNLGIHTEANPDELREKMVAWNKALQEKKRFIGWLDDESAWGRVPLASLERNYRLYFKYAPDYVVWQNHAPRMTGSSNEKRQSPENIRRYSRQADVTGVDIYPIPGTSGHSDLPNKTLSCVGDYTRLASQSAWDEKPIWMILQAFGWSESGGGKLNERRPRPTKDELRFMVYNAITHGATGIIWYGEMAKDIYSADWAALADVCRELNEVGKVWASGVEQTLPSGHADVTLQNVQTDNGGVIIAVNEGSETRTLSLTLEGTYYRSPDGEPVKSGAFQLPPFSVLILSREPITIKPTPVFEKVADHAPLKRGYNIASVLLEGEWVAHPEVLQGNNQTVFGRQQFLLDEIPSSAKLRVCGDDEWKVVLNGRAVGEGRGHRAVHEYEITPLLKQGENQLRFELMNVGGPTGIVYELRLGNQLVTSGEKTEFSRDGRTAWTQAHLFGRPPVKPWGEPSSLYLQ